MNVAEIGEAMESLAGASFDPEGFVPGFMAAYDAAATTITRLRRGETNHTEVDGAWLWRNKLHALPAPETDVDEALTRLRDSRTTRRYRARFVLATDGENVAAEDRTTGDTLRCRFAELGDHFAFFLPLAGYERYGVAAENPVDVQATGRLANLYGRLKALNPDWATPERQHEAHLFMTRVVFCLFAESTDIIPEKLFSKIVHERCEPEASNAHEILKTVSDAMDARGDARNDLPRFAKDFPYVNGGLFMGSHEVPRFDRQALGHLKDAGHLNWRRINPDIFGSMIQSVTDENSRGNLGLHYTSVPNILKVLGPLFLDDLKAELERAEGNEKKLKKFLARLERIRVFDPACGSGNFLVIAYRELRTLEIEALKKLAEVSGVQTQGLFSRIPLSNFYGIEYADFAAETAKLSLWVSEYQMNKLFEAEVGRGVPDLPLKEGGNIVRDNALRIEWTDICPTLRGYETYCVGNPPYVGHRDRTSEQREDMRLLLEGRIEGFGDLDYVCCWFVKAADYVFEKSASFAFVATSSICQGRQVPLMWPHVLSEGLEIAFAHLPFEWANNARRNAAVVCAVVGVRNASNEPRYLIENGRKRTVRHVNAYLVEADDIYVEGRERPFAAGLPRVDFGDMPNDHRQLVLSREEKDTLLRDHPEAGRFVRRRYGNTAFIEGHEWYCLWIGDEERREAEKIPEIARRVEEVARWRRSRGRSQTRRQAFWPHRFGEVRSEGASTAIIIPRHFGVRRPYVPAGLLTAGEVVTDSALALYDAPEWAFSLISSRLHWVWVATVCGRIYWNYRYSGTFGWHTFPLPPLSRRDKEDLGRSAENILLAREEAGPTTTVAEMYLPGMPTALADAHRENDDLVERIFFGRPLANDTERVQRLFKRYAKLVEEAAEQEGADA